MPLAAEPTTSTSSMWQRRSSLLSASNASDDANSTSTNPDRQLPTTVQLHILSLLPQNDRALNGRLACRDAHNGLTGPQHCTASLSQPLPPHAVPWALEAGQQHVRQLPFRHKLRLLNVAAVSGSEVNLEVAWALLQPSIFPEMLKSSKPLPCGWYGEPQPGLAAIEAGHPQLLGWLLRHCPALIHLGRALQAAARHCGLAELQAVWAALRDGLGGGSNEGGSASGSKSGGESGNASGGESSRSGSGVDSSRRPVLDQHVLDAAAQSSTPDASTKLEWLLAAADHGRCSLQESTAVAAARSGDLGRLRWLRERGCKLQSQSVLLRALEHADLAVAQWLVDEAGCELPAQASDGSYDGWDLHCDASTRSAVDVLAKLQWLQDRGAPPLDSDDALLPFVATAAVEAGREQVLRFLLAAYGPAKVFGQRFNAQAALAKSRSIPVAKCLREAGCLFTDASYRTAATAGDMALLRWLAEEAGTSACDLHSAEVFLLWPRCTPQDSSSLLEAVPLLVGAGSTGWTGDAIFGAVQRGDLALVQYLVPGRAPWESLHPWDVLGSAAGSGCEALLEWLVARAGCLDGVLGLNSPYSYAAAQGDKGTLVALRRLGVPWGMRGLVRDAWRRGSPPPGLQWLVEQGALVTEGLAGAETVLKFLDRAMQSEGLT